MLQKSVQPEMVEDSKTFSVPHFRMTQVFFCSRKLCCVWGATSLSAHTMTTNMTLRAQKASYLFSKFRYIFHVAYLHCLYFPESISTIDISSCYFCSHVCNISVLKNPESTQLEGQQCSSTALAQWKSDQCPSGEYGHCMVTVKGDTFHEKNP